MKKILIFTAIALLVGAGSAFSASLNLSGWYDITINDGIWNTTTYDGTSDPRSAVDPRDLQTYQVLEDNETERLSDGRNTIGAQNWDLEGVFLKGTTLALVGGYDFIGVSGFEFDSAPGDVFLATGTAEQPAVGGILSAIQAGTRGYDYVLDLKYAPGIDNYGSGVAYENSLSLRNPNAYVYDVIRLNNGAFGGTTATTVNTDDVIEASPWAFAGASNAADAVLLASNVPVSYYNSAVDNISGGAYDNFLGGTHYALVLDLAAIGLVPGSVDILTHFTMRCGNDALIGATTFTGGSPVPEPTTMLLLGTGLIGLAGAGRKKFAKKG